jgi:mRNA interferase MazF
MNRHLRTIVIAPMTTSERHYPTRFEIEHNKKKGYVVLDQIRTIDRSRITKVLGAISKQEITMCKAIIKETFVD